MRCLGCGTGLQGKRDISYCDICREDIRLIHEPFCSVCSKPFDKAAGATHTCGSCLRNRWYFKQARAVVCFQGSIAEAVRSFKYNGRMDGLATFAALTEQYFLQQPRPCPDLILPVPLHPKRLRRRGFNQAVVLGRKFFPNEVDRVDPHILERSTWSRPQTGLSSSERIRNVKNAFRLRYPEKIANKRILLVDDVFTTGATVNECARVLVRNRAARVEVFTFARTIDRG